MEILMIFSTSIYLLMISVLGVIELYTLQKKAACLMLILENSYFSIVLVLIKKFSSSS